MVKETLNIFINYKQSENNITHGFLSLLRCLENSTVRDICLRVFSKIKLHGKLTYDIQNPSPVNKIYLDRAKKGYLLGISSIETKILQDKSSKKTSRADGWVFDSNNNIVLIESKIVGKFSGDQLKRHEKKLKNYVDSDINSEIITWQQIDNTLKVVSMKNDLKRTELKLIKSYRRYLQMEGLTLDFEKFYNATEENIEKYWVGSAPQKTLKLLKMRISESIPEIKMDNQQHKQTRMNYYWLRIFQKKIGSIDWRGTIYINPDAVSIDVLSFKPNKSHIPIIVNKMKKIASKQDNEDKLRTWFYATKYGKRRNVQKGRDYEYCSLNHNVKKGSKIMWNKLSEITDVLEPKQIGIRFSVSNPSSSSETYWNDKGVDINHKDAELLKDPEKLTNKFKKFIKIGISVVEEKI